MDFMPAKADCEKALELDPKYVKAWYRKGCIEQFMKESHKAMESFSKGIEIDPDNELCKKGLNDVRMSVAQQQSGDVDEERAAHALADPEIQSILRDPVIQQVLSDLKENPSSGQQALRDPAVSAKLSKLIAAGVLRTG